MTTTMPTSNDLSPTMIRNAFGLVVNGIDNNAIGYWCEIDKVNLPEGFTPRRIEWLSMKQRDFYTTVRTLYFAPFVTGGSLVLAEVDEVTGERTRHVLDYEAIERGLLKMQEIAPRHYADMIAGDDDIVTADVFFQCACFGEIKYG